MLSDEPPFERQMGGCMAGFFHIFDRNYALPPKKYVSSKHLLDTESISASEKSQFSSPKNTPSKKMSGVEMREKPWKLLEVSRLSLDSRVQSRSPGAVARLMGLDVLPDPKPVMLQRSVSESRARTDPNFYRFVDVSSFEKVAFSQKKKKNDALIQRKSFEYFPEMRGGTRNSMRTVPVLTKDLETMKQVLEAVQLRGLLHYDRVAKINGQDSSPIVLMKPNLNSKRVLRSEKRDPQSVTMRCNNERRGVSRNIKKDEGRRGKVSPVKSPLGSPKKVGAGLTDGLKSGRRRNGEKCIRNGTGSDVRTKSSSQYNVVVGEHRNGEDLLERCDKLLSSIAAITSSDVNTGEDLQPSPVSVLDSVFLEDKRSPFPHSKRTLHFQDQPLDQDLCGSSHETRTVGFGPCEDGYQSDDPDFPYVAEMVRLANHHHDISELNTIIQKHDQSDRDTSLHIRLIFEVVKEILAQQNNVSTWDMFLGSKSLSNIQSSQKLHIVWREVKRIREPIVIDEENDFTFTAVKKDMSHDPSWVNQSVELSDVVIQIERLIFKDLVADTIRELVDVAIF